MDKQDSAQVVITEENLTGLPFLRNLSMGLFRDWEYGGVVENTALIDEIKPMFLFPVQQFDEAYDNFIKVLSVGSAINVLNDRWRVFMMAFITELGDEANETLTKFLNLAKRILHDAPGGDEIFARKLHYGFDSNLPSLGAVPSMKIDYVILLALRFYVASATTPAPQSQEK